MIPVAQRLPTAWRSDLVKRPSPRQTTEGYLRFFEPDILVETAPGQFARAGLTVDEIYNRKRRIAGLDALIRTEPGRRPDFDVSLGMHHVYDHLFSTDFQYRRRVERPVLRFSGGDRVGRAFYETCYGMFPEREDISYVKEYYDGALEALEVRPDVEAWHKLERQQASCPLDFTLHGTEQQFHGHWDETIFIFDPLSGADVIDFWNARLFVREPIPVNSHWLAASRDLVVDYIRHNHRPLPSNPNGVTIGTRLRIGRSLDSNSVMAELDLDKASLSSGSLSVQTWYDHIGDASQSRRGWRRELSHLTSESRDVDVSVGDSDTIRVPQLSPPYTKFTRGAGPAWVNVISPRFYAMGNQYAEAVPSAAIDLNPYYPAPGMIDQWPTCEGWLTFQNFAHDQGFFRLLKMNVAVTSWLKSQNLEAVPSDAGRVADRVIEAAGGVDGTPLLANEVVLRQLDKMARSRTEHTDGSVEEYPDRTATFDQLKPMLKAIKDASFGQAASLKRFVDMGALRLGLSAKCDHCAKENWYGLDDVAMTIQCNRCLRTFPFPQGELPPKNTWKYRVVGPFAVPHYAQGAYSVALTLGFLKRRLGSLPSFTFTTSLELSSGAEKLETDFFAWYDEDRMGRAGADPLLFVGECKSFGKEVFKKADIDRLQRLGELLPGAYLVASTLKSDLSEVEREQLRRLCKWGWKRRRTDRRASRVILLTGRELFDPHGFRRSEGAASQRSDALDWSRIYEFGELAVATQRAYLGFSKEELFAMMYGRPRP
ncbi:hypothetical protein LO749_14865 [Paracoccus denitrificans]|uniref:hypothetical protein n=1 Tax=Paracoccus denitrificans TaxID=266 RepID=UPI001E31AD75|nr:hypothetical protein [Paracoccus denitrificans]UFS67388.1 hypothetical protein LO749_14865 [Paracoccus denitrificans]